MVALTKATPAASARDNHVVVEKQKAQLERALAEFVQLCRSARLAHENAGDFERGKELDRRYHPSINEQVEATLLQLRKRFTHLGDIKNSN